MRNIWTRMFAGPIASPIDVMKNLDGDGLLSAPVDWIQLPDGNGSSVVFKDATGHSTTLTANNSVQAWNVGGGREITSSSGRVYCGAGSHAPTQGTKGNDGTGGVQVVISADGAANTTFAETTVGSVLDAGLIDPFVHVHTLVTADAANNAVIVFKLYRANALVKTWTFTTDLTMGNLVAGVLVSRLDPFACVKGDYLTCTQTKGGTGVQLPLRSVGGVVVPT